MTLRYFGTRGWKRIFGESLHPSSSVANPDIGLEPGLFLRWKECEEMGNFVNSTCTARVYLQCADKHIWLKVYARGLGSDIAGSDSEIKSHANLIRFGVRIAYDG